VKDQARAGLRSLAGSPPGALAATMLERFVPARPDTLAILTFHRVTQPGPTVAPGLLSATPAGFGTLLDRLQAHHTVVDMAAVLHRLDGGPALPRRSLLLTFDDAYVDMAEHCWPALRARGLPAVLFVPTAYPDAPDRVFWWEDLHAAIAVTTSTAVDGPAGTMSLVGPGARTHAYKTLRDACKALPHRELVAAVERIVRSLQTARPISPVLGWDALRSLAAEGLTLAPHTRSHPLLTRLDPALLDDEIGGSRTDLAAATGQEAPALAYPAGAVSRPVADAVARSGIRVAFTTARGVNDMRTADPFLLRRVNVSVRTPDPAIRAQLLR
jgi:peptidoglycan/xylan/chitin deacetylase (PgdA/CDA1 family)